MLDTGDNVDWFSLYIHSAVVYGFKKSLLFLKGYAIHSFSESQNASYKWEISGSMK